MKNTLTIEITKAYEVDVEATDIDMAFEEFLNTSYEKHLVRVYFPEPADFKINKPKKPKPKEKVNG